MWLHIALAVSPAPGQWACMGLQPSNGRAACKSRIFGSGDLNLESADFLLKARGFCFQMCRPSALSLSSREILFTEIRGRLDVATLLLLAIMPSTKRRASAKGTWVTTRRSQERWD